MTEIIREARPEDYEPIVKLLNQVQELHEQWRPDIYKFNRSFSIKAYLRRKCRIMQFM